MSRLMLSPADRGIVVFRIWPSLPYSARVMIAAGSLAAGLLWQVLTMALFPGILLVLAGNLFLLVCGYNNNAEYAKFSPSLEWRPATIEKVREIRELDRKMKQWDRSFLDITNVSGRSIFILIVIALAALFFLAVGTEQTALLIVTVNAGVLLLPHWITGVRRILTRPRLMLKIDALLKLLDSVEPEIADDKLELSLLMERRGNGEIPSDVRFRYVPKGAGPGFLGLQGQMAVNEVQGTSYIYFYVVAIAKEGYGLSRRLGDWQVPPGLVLEPSSSGGVEVLVLRRRTTKKSGYSTDAHQISSIFHYGRIMARRVIDSIG
jgi:hypothetical protein